MTLLFFDTETTGKYDFKKPPNHPNQPDLVQLAALLCEDDGTEIEEMNRIVHPYGFEIPAEAANVHGITTAVALERGVDVEQVIEEFTALIARADKLVGHNVSFDLEIWRTLLHRKGRARETYRGDFICTMRTATDVCKLPGRYRRQYKWPTLQEAYQLLVDEAGFEGAHDALADVRACKAVYFALCDKGIIN